MSGRICKLVRLPGLTDYGEALALQRRLARQRVAGQLEADILLLLEHGRVITLGRGARKSNITVPTEFLERKGIEVHEVERGGDVTYHGPGQLVGYPIIDLTRHKQDLHWYLRRLEEVLIRSLAAYDILARRIPSFTGVWVGDRKIASIGVHVTRWVTFHGFALNVTTDLSDFELIVPCGIDDVNMTSVAKEMPGAPISVSEVSEHVSRCWGEVFDVLIQTAALRDLQ
ncbi:MAG: lipoyl(octanoyl) transferase LipB [Gemmatimonadota bacterium]|nr:MAG: lipoyl(octanoyl) transferase LipB [Gemmatimonadota bacterium]